ncbi:hypothetical protein [Boudabousia liubingyangii]|nr:hypothetical protein [Boudabousia liubingyangii]
MSMPPPADPKFYRGSYENPIEVYLRRRRHHRNLRRAALGVALVAALILGNQNLWPDLSSLVGAGQLPPMPSSSKNVGGRTMGTPGATSDGEILVPAHVDARQAQEIAQRIEQYATPIQTLLTNAGECPEAPVTQPQDLDSFINTWNDSRRLVGLKPITALAANHPAWKDLSEGGISLARSLKISHGLVPAKDFKCRTVGGAKATYRADINYRLLAGSSNVMPLVNQKSRENLPRVSYELINFLDDDGKNNENVGHRIDMLDPTLDKTAVSVVALLNTGEVEQVSKISGYQFPKDNLGYGFVISSSVNALTQVRETDDQQLSEAARAAYPGETHQFENLRSAPPQIAWPAAGYVPAKLMPGALDVPGFERTDPGRWSLSVRDQNPSLFVDAKVEVWEENTFNGEAHKLPLQSETPVNPLAANRFGYPTITFKPLPLDHPGFTKLPVDTVKVFRVRVTTKDGHSWQYPVKTFSRLETFQAPKLELPEAIAEMSEAEHQQLPFKLTGTAGTDFGLELSRAGTSAFYPLFHGAWDGRMMGTELEEEISLTGVALRPGDRVRMWARNDQGESAVIAVVKGK